MIVPKTKTFLWDGIRRKAEIEFYNVAGGPKHTIGYDENRTAFLALFAAATMTPPRKPMDVLSEWVEEGCKLIRAWDIRRVKKLIELFPSCVPKCYQSLPILLDTDDKDRWCVTFQSPVRDCVC